MVLLEKQLAVKRQQVKDLSAFTVVLGTRGAAGKPDFQMLEASGQNRFFAGPFLVGGHVLSFIASFLSWKKVELQSEWKSPDGLGERNGGLSFLSSRGVRSCHISP